jgi:hypothetical protein
MDAGIESPGERVQIPLEGGARSYPKSLGADSAGALRNYTSRRGSETIAHARLKRLALLWAQANGYSACAFEVSLPQSGYRADIAAYRPESSEIGSTAVFECKQALVDLRRDNGSTVVTRERLEKVYQRRQVLEKNLRVHYPQLRIRDSLFAEFNSHDFSAIKHRGYRRVSRELSRLQNRLFDCTKFEKLIRYGCANLFFLVLPIELFREPEIPSDWGALVESNGALELLRKPVWHKCPPEKRLLLLERIAAKGTRALNRQLEITFEDVQAARCRSC